jgi:carbon storage regulator
MLLINRKRGESIVLGDRTTVTVLDVRGDKVRLAITCPKEVPVHRQEVFDAIHGRSPLPPRPAAERPFWEAILEAPGDEGTRLVFADWLEERGDPLGEFLRNQCRLARLDPGDARGRELEGRQRALWAEHGAAWGAALPPALWSGRGGGSCPRPTA